MTKFTLEFENKAQAVRVAVAIEDAADGADPEGHRRYRALLASVLSQLGMPEPEPCGCIECTGPWQEK